VATRSTLSMRRSLPCRTEQLRKAGGEAQKGRAGRAAGVTGNNPTPSVVHLVRLTAIVAEMKVWLVAAKCFVWMKWPRPTDYALNRGYQLHRRFEELRDRL
jgi:hypothetical protein